MTKTPDELFEERTKRFADAIALKEPDRVPVAPTFGFFYAKYAGLSPEETFYAYDKWSLAVKKTVMDFEPDMVNNPRSVIVAPGPLLDIVDFRQIKWPGHGITGSHSFQYVEGEYMKAEEYDAFLDDPSDYIIRTYLPRIYGELKPLEKLPPLSSMMTGYLATHLTSALARADIMNALETVARAGTESLKWRAQMDSLHEDIRAMGFPFSSYSAASVPFDVIGDYLRGTRGVMLDMYRRPEKLLRAIEKVLPMQLKAAVLIAKRSGNPRVFIPLHKGADSFMSLEQFKTFFWPALKKLIVGLIDEGLTPWVLVESDYTSRLEIMRDIPAGKAIYHFEQTDMFKAKDILGDVVCIRGGVPNSLLYTGTPEDVKDHCKKLINIIGKGGGYIMDSGALIDEAQPENIKAMIDFTREYGVYS